LKFVKHIFDTSSTHSGQFPIVVAPHKNQLTKVLTFKPFHGNSDVIKNAEAYADVMCKLRKRTKRNW